MKILLINIPFVFESKNDISLSHCLGILQIASFLKQNNCDVEILDALQLGINNVQKKDGYYRVGLTNQQIVDKINYDYDLIGISIPFSHLAFLAHELIDKIKEFYAKIPIVIGGVYPSTQPKLAIQSKADFIVIGEGEEPMLQLVNYLEKNIKDLPNCIIHKNANLDLVEPYFSPNINQFDLPARELVDFQEYTLNPPRNDANGLRSASIITSRGCPYDCGFCSVHPVCGYKWRPLSSQKVLYEIQYLIENYHVNNIQIEDDNFTINPSRAEEILKGIIELNKHKTKISWQASNGLRIDTLNKNLIRLISESNCRYISIALEHGSKEMLEIMNKKLSLTKVWEVVQLLAKYNVRTFIYVIYGYPGETKERFNEALKFYFEIKKLSEKIDFNFFIAQPYPNTQLFRDCVEKGYLPINLFDDVYKINRFSTLNKIWIETPDFTIADIRNRKKILNKKLIPKKSWAKILFDKILSILSRIYRQLK